MSTPTFKLLLNAMRLGQPQDPQAAICALVEALSAQEDVIDDLRRKLQVVQSAAQILETKAARLELDIETVRLQMSSGGQPSAALAPQSLAPQSLAPQSLAPQSSRQPSPTSASQPPQPYAQPPQPYAQPPQPYAQPPHPYAQQQGHPCSQQPQSQPYAPPPQQQPYQQQHQQQHQQQSPQTQRAGAFAQPQPASRHSAPGSPDDAAPQRGSVSSEEPRDEFRVETMVVNRKDLAYLKNPDAPFRLAPPGQRVIPDRGSIPGAPWARGARAQQPQAAAPIMDEFTTESSAQQGARDGGEDETYSDGGGISSLAAALGLAPDDPRIHKPRSSHCEEQSKPGEPGIPPHKR